MTVGFTRPHVIGFFADFFFLSEEQVQKYPDVCGRKLYPERKSCGLKNILYMWTVPKIPETFRKLDDHRCLGSGMRGIPLYRNDKLLVVNS